MKKTVKKVISSVLVAAMLLSFVPMSGVEDLTFDFTVKSSAKETSGKLGDDAYYSLNEDSGLLTISGSGEMNNYSNHNISPFYYKKSIIKDVVVDEGILNIGDSVFDGCTAMTSISLPESIVSIGNFAFLGCSGIKSLMIPKNTTNIGFQAFFGCSGLSEIRIPESIGEISNGMFQGCTGLTSVTISDGITGIGYSAFDNCTNLTNITIPDGVTRIEENAFSRCTGLTSIIIPQSVTSIGDGAFSYCSKLADITIPKGITCIGSRLFSDCINLTDLIIPDSVTSIGDEAFKHCIRLNSIAIPSSVTSVGKSAFEDCESLSNVSITRNISVIGSNAFAGCNMLNAVCVESERLLWGENTFPNNKVLQFFVPKGSNVYDTLTSQNYNVIPYSMTERTYKDKNVLSLDNKVVLSEDVWSCICELIRNTDVHYIYFEELDFGDMMPEDIVADFDKSDFNYKQVVFSIEKDGETIRLGSIAEKSSFQIFIDMLVDAFSFVLDSVISGIKGIISSIRKWWK